MAWGGNDLHVVFVPIDRDEDDLPGYRELAVDGAFFMDKVFPVAQLQLKSQITSRAFGWLDAQNGLCFPPAPLHDRRICFLEELLNHARLADPHTDRVIGIAPDGWLCSRLNFHDCGSKGVYLTKPSRGRKEPLPAVIVEIGASPHAPAHEIGHTYRLNLSCEDYDVNCNGHGSSYGSPVNDGFDPFSRRIMNDGDSANGTTHHVYHFMGDNAYNPPADDRWVTEEAYDFLISSQSASTQPLSTEARSSRQMERDSKEPVLLMTGIVNADGTAHLGSYYSISEGQTSDLPLEGDFLIQLLGENDEVLYQGGIGASIMFGGTDEPPIQSAPLSAVIPFSSQARYVVLKFQGREVDRRLISANPPIANILSPIANQVVTDTLTVTWQATDPDGDQTRAVLLLSDDEGQTWTAIRTELEEQTYDLDLSEASSGNRYRVKIIVTDGVNTDETVSPAFTVMHVNTAYLPLIARNSEAAEPQPPATYPPTATPTRTPTPIRTPTATQTLTPTPSPTAFAPDSNKIAIIEEINVAREDEGVSPLRVDSRLMRAAQVHSGDIAAHDIWSHTGSDGSSPQDRMQRAGYSLGAGDEILAANSTDASAIVSAWLSNSDHRSILMNSEYEDIGVGYAYNPDSAYHHYWTLNLAYPSSDGSRWIELTPQETAVGWVASNEPSQNHFGDDDVYAGFFANNTYLGGIQFDLSSLPTRIEVLEAELLLTGQTRERIRETGTWKVELLSSTVDAGWPNHTFSGINSATAVGALQDLSEGDFTLEARQLDVGKVNRLGLTQSLRTELSSRRQSTGFVSFRVSGPMTGNNVFSWDTGYGSGGLLEPPVLKIKYTTANELGPTPTAARTLIPTPSQTPLPSAYLPDQLLVKFHSETTEEEKASIHRQLGAQKIDEIRQLNVEILETSSDVMTIVSRYQQESAVLYAEPDYRFRISGFPISSIIPRGKLEGVRQRTDSIPDDPLISDMWNLSKIDVYRAWDIAQGNPNVLIAAIDTGVWPTHPDLSGKLVSGYDFVNNDSDPTDDQGHGTHMAGVAAAATNNGAGIAGVGYDVRVMPLKVLTASGEGSHSLVSKAIIWAADHGARIINLGGGSPYSSNTLKRSVDYAWNEDLVMVAPVGNGNSSSPVYPAAYDHVVGVAGIDQDDRRASFSNYGDYVAISSPGVSIMGTVRGGDYQAWSGTSMASAQVAGVGALIASLHPDWDNARIRRVLESSAEDLGSAGWDPSFGYGRLNAYRALIGAETQDSERATKSSSE